MNRYAGGLLLAVFLLLLMGGSVTASEPQPTASTTQYLPFVIGGPAPVVPTCEPTPEEAQLAELMKTHPEQKRPFMVCDPTLERAARAMAQDMAARGYFGHITPEGLGPNELVRQAGYPLTSVYDSDPTANNIQSIGAGGTLEALWPLWMTSASHHHHIIGDSAFWIAQTDYGIGYHYDPTSQKKHYWVILTAVKEGAQPAP